MAVRLALVAAAALQVAAAEPSSLAGEIRRGFAAAGSKTSEQPALREEQAARTPSQGFMLGIALGAWTNAAAQLRYDLEVPSGDGDDSAAIDLDCHDERVAFRDLAGRMQAAGLSAQAVVAAGQAGEAAALSRLNARLAEVPPRCR